MLRSQLNESSTMSNKFQAYKAGQYVMLTDSGLEAAGCMIRSRKDAEAILKPIKIISVSENLGDRHDFFQDIDLWPKNEPESWKSLLYSSWDVRPLTPEERLKFKL